MIFEGGSKPETPIEKRVQNLESTLGNIHREILTIQENQNIESTKRTAPFGGNEEFFPKGFGSPTSTVSSKQGDMDRFMDERVNFERAASSNFQDIFNKLNDLGNLMGQLITKNEDQTQRSVNSKPLTAEDMLKEE